MSLEEELLFARDLAQKAGQIAQARQSHLSVTYKPHNQGPVSDAEIYIDDLIRKSINERFPHDGMVTEESYDNGPLPQAHRVWFVDPIDGTSSYVKGRDDYVVMIGLAIGGQASLGAICHPASNTTWYGMRNKSSSVCYKMQDSTLTKIHLVSAPQHKEITIVMSRFHISRKQQFLNEKIAAQNIKKMSSVGLKAMTVIDKDADLYVCWSRRVHLWDTCAPLAIVRASGGFMGYVNGQEPSYCDTIHHNMPLFVSNFHPDQELAEFILNLAQS